MSTTSTIAKGRGGDFKNKNLSYLDTSVTSFVITMPVTEIPNENATSGVRTRTGPDDVLCELSGIVSSPSRFVMHDAVGDVETNQAGDSVTIWKVWVEGIHSSEVAKQIEQSIREISSTKFPGYAFNTVTVEVENHYYTS